MILGIGTDIVEIGRIKRVNKDHRLAKRADVPQPKAGSRRRKPSVLQPHYRGPGKIVVLGQGIALKDLRFSDSNNFHNLHLYFPQVL